MRMSLQSSRKRKENVVNLNLSSSWKWGECERCRLSCNLATHECFLYEYKLEDYNDDWEKKYAPDMESLAIIVAQVHDDGDYDLLNGGETIIVVKKNSDPDDRAKRFKVTGRLEPYYNVKEI